MDSVMLTAAIESVLFASERPVTVEKLQEVLGEETATRDEIETAVETLASRYSDVSFGFEVRRAQGGYQFCTKQVHAGWVRKFLEAKPFRLSRSAMETLAVIAYKQPITRAEIDSVRGIDSSHLLRTLIEKGIVKMAGKADVPGRPVQYGTTSKFLDLVGLKSLSDLPPLSELKELEGDVPKKDRIEEGMDAFIESEEILDDRQKELDAGLDEIDGLIKSAGNSAREVHPSALHAEIAEENEAAAVGFQAFSRGWKKSRAAKHAANEASAEAEGAETAEMSSTVVDGDVSEENSVGDDEAAETSVPADFEVSPEDLAGFEPLDENTVEEEADRTEEE